jgi:hypothetical protein
MIVKSGKTIKSLFFKEFFPLVLVGIGLISFGLLLKKHDLDYGMSLMECVLMLYAIASYLWARSKQITVVVFIRWACFSYIALSYLYAVVYKQANVLDFLLIYKSFIYLYFLTFLAGRKLMSFNSINRLTLLLFGIFFFKYFVMVALGLSARPIVYAENNFELMLLYALYMIRYSVTKEKYLHLLAFVGIITILSLSRSSLLMYSVLFLFVIYDSFKKLRVFFIPGALIILGGIVVYIFAQRSDSLEDVDRYRFMLVWWTNVQDWNILQWMVGSERITPLSAYSCGMMNYFKTLFSYSNNGTCYSVILHSFIFRVLYDHGVLGFLFIIWSTYTMLIKSKVRKDMIWVFIVIVLINGLSVSSFNNLFFAISMVFLMSTNMEFPKPAEDHIIDPLYDNSDNYLEQNSDEIKS